MQHGGRVGVGPAGAWCRSTYHDAHLHAAVRQQLLAVDLDNGAENGHEAAAEPGTKRAWRRHASASSRALLQGARPASSPWQQLPSSCRCVPVSHLHRDLVRLILMTDERSALVPVSGPVCMRANLPTVLLSLLWSPAEANAAHTVRQAPPPSPSHTHTLSALQYAISVPFPPLMCSSARIQGTHLPPSRAPPPQAPKSAPTFCRHLDTLGRALLAASLVRGLGGLVRCRFIIVSLFIVLVVHLQRRVP